MNMMGSNIYEEGFKFNEMKRIKWGIDENIVPILIKEMGEQEF
jgi:hypothetical protein